MVLVAAVVLVITIVMYLFTGANPEKPKRSPDVILFQETIADTDTWGEDSDNDEGKEPSSRMIQGEGIDVDYVLGGPLLPGADIIYPTISINGNLYEWHKGAAVFAELPKGVVYYGKIKHVNDKTPNKDCAMSSIFSVSGLIFTVPGDDSICYLYLTTDWFKDKAVLFDVVTIAISEENHSIEC